MTLLKILPILLLASLSLKADESTIPFFELDDGYNESSLPLISQHVEASVSGVIANVKITQVYQNSGDQTIHASYLFPASTRAAVHRLQMTLGERTIHAEIKEKQEAQKIHEEAKKQHKTSSLLEQERPNIFRMNVANILPNDKIKITLEYSEHIISTEGVYSFSLPTTIGPRYSNGTTHLAQNPYILPKAKTSTGIPIKQPTLSVDLSLNTSLPLQNTLCKTHSVNTDFINDRSANITYVGTQKDPGMNRDFTVHYELTKKEVSSGVLLHKDKEEQFFLLNVQPPKRVKPTHITPRDYVFVIDVSGSMNGFPLKTAKELFHNLSNTLTPNDSFNLIKFAGASEQLSKQSLPATESNIKKAIQFLTNSQGRGGTELTKALENAYNLPNIYERSRSILIITDGYISFEAQSFELIRNNLHQANLFAFGIGSSVNHHLIEGMARVGNGEPFIVTDKEKAKSTANRLKEYIEAPVLTSLKLTADGITIYDTEPNTLSDVFANRPVTLVGKWKGKKKNGSITLAGISGNGEHFSQTFKINTTDSQDNPALRSLWAREKVRYLADYQSINPDTDKKSEIINLGLEYSLLTPYTSFIAVDHTVREMNTENTTESPKTILQPSAIPQGMEIQAQPSGFISQGSVPEPSILTLLIVSLSSLILRRQRQTHA